MQHWVWEVWCASLLQIPSVGLDMKDGKISVLVSTALKSSCPDVNQNNVWNSSEANQKGREKNQKHVIINCSGFIDYEGQMRFHVACSTTSTITPSQALATMPLHSALGHQYPMSKKHQRPTHAKTAHGICWQNDYLQWGENLDYLLFSFYGWTAIPA